MRLHGDYWHLRLMGNLFDTGSIDFGVTANVTGLIVLIGSLITTDIRDVW